MKPPLFFYNSALRKKHLFQPLDPACLRLYVCGPTVYDRIHIGNARTIVVFDVLFRLLKYYFPQVIYVRNITDIDDKIIQAALKNGTDIATFTQKTCDLFHQDCALLGTKAPTFQPLATQYVDRMIAMIQTLVNQGFAYVNEQHVLFEVHSFKNYGSLGGVDLTQAIPQEDGAHKRHPLDFVLWKPSPRHPGYPGWHSPWGWGRPGWHIECSAMSSDFFGPHFDLHGGGRDLMFPHHDNELAQSCAAFGCSQTASVWMHNGMLTLKGSKMAKSLGNILSVHEACCQANPQAVRWALLSTHYRSELEWSTELLAQSHTTLQRILRTLSASPLTTSPSLPPDPEIISALADDLNTPLALTRLSAIAGHIRTISPSSQTHNLYHTLKASLDLLGLMPPEDPNIYVLPADIQTYLDQRNAARARKDFSEADRLRDVLANRGILVEDHAQGETTWKRH